MPETTTSLDRIAHLKAQIASLEQSALQELMERRNALSHELGEVDAQISALSGKPAESKRSRSGSPRPPGLSLPLQDLKLRLANAPDKTISIRKENLDLANIKTLATANPTLLKLGGKGPWPTVTLLK